MNKEFQLRLRKFIEDSPPRLPGKRSAELAQQIIAIPERQRTFLQRRLLTTYEQGECIGCNYHGEPLAVDGRELPVTRETNGFAAPAEFCDCADGVSFQKRIRRQRKEYIQQDIRARRAYAQRLFGLSTITPPSMQERTLDTWPIEFDADQENIDELTYREMTRTRAFLVDLLRTYPDDLYFRVYQGPKRGLCLVGKSGVGKTGLICSLEPLLARRGHFMLSLYIPELLRLVKYSEQAEEMIKVMKTVEVLFLDDLGYALIADPVSIDTYSLFARVLDERLKHNRPTFITSNLDEDLLEMQFGQYILSRIQALCYLLAVPGVDFR